MRASRGCVLPATWTKPDTTGIPDRFVAAIIKTNVATARNTVKP
jgi:hypothetical protein